MTAFASKRGIGKFHVDAARFIYEADESIARAAATIDDAILHAREHGMEPMVVMTLGTRAAVCAAAGDEEGRHAANDEAVALARSINAVGALKLLDAEPAVEP